MTDPKCALCADPGGELLFEDVLCRVVVLGGDEGKAFPGFCRVIWKRHVREMTDLTDPERRHLLNVVLATESAVRDVQKADKINLASLGNVVPHLHWHVIPRWMDDSHFPGPIWAAAQRTGRDRPLADVNALHKALERALINSGGLSA